MAAGEAAISSGLRGTWCPMAGTGIYQTVKNLFSACFQYLEGSQYFRARSWPGLCWLLLAAPCTCWRGLPHHHWSWQQTFPPNAISPLTNFLPLSGPGPSPVTTWFPLSCVPALPWALMQGLMMELHWILLQCGFHLLSHNKMDKPNDCFDFFFLYCVNNGPVFI